MLGNSKVSNTKCKKCNKLKAEEKNRIERLEFLKNEEKKYSDQLNALKEEKCSDEAIDALAEGAIEALTKLVISVNSKDSPNQDELAKLVDALERLEEEAKKRRLERLEEEAKKRRV